MIRVYLAGKIEAWDDWRFEIFSDLRTTGAEVVEVKNHRWGWYESALSEFPAEREAPSRPGFKFAGPYFVSHCSCRTEWHGGCCYQGLGGHGQGRGFYSKSNHGTLCGPETVSADIIERCLAWLENSDVVFAWFSGPAAYGTAAELGYAKAKGIPIYVYERRFDPAGQTTYDLQYGEDREHTWFPRGLGDWGGSFEEVTGAWMDFSQRVDRELRVLKLRRMPYQEYLQTDHWKAKRAEALAVAEYRCQVCNGMDGITVHHRTYERRGEELLSDLIALCRSCHGLFHGSGKLATSKLPSEEKRR